MCSPPRVEGACQRCHPLHSLPVAVGALNGPAGVLREAIDTRLTVLPQCDRTMALTHAAGVGFASRPSTKIAGLAGDRRAAIMPESEYVTANRRSGRRKPDRRSQEASQQPATDLKGRPGLAGPGQYGCKCQYGSLRARARPPGALTLALALRRSCLAVQGRAAARLALASH